MLDSKEIRKIAEQHENLCKMIENLDKAAITLTVEGMCGTNVTYISGKCETELKVLQTIANSLKELAVTYERQIQNIVRKELRE